MANQQHRLRPTTLHSYTMAVARISGRLGKVPVQALTPLQIEKFYGDLLRGGGRDGRPLSAKTVAIKDERIYTALVVLPTTGMRRGEVPGLRWSDLDLDAGQLAVVQTLTAVNGEAMIGLTKDVAQLAHRVPRSADGERAAQTPQTPQAPTTGSPRGRRTVVDPWLIHFFQRHVADDPARSVPVVTFLDGLPDKVVADPSLAGLASFWCWAAL